MAKTKKEDLNLLFTFLTSLLGVWYFILLYIIDTTKLEPSNHDLFVISVVHYLVFFLLTINITLFFIVGLEEVSPKSKLTIFFIKHKTDLKKILYLTWLPVIILSIITYTFNHILSFSFKKFESYIILFLLGSFLILLVRVKGSLSQIALYITLILFSYVYIFFMSVIFCDIDIKPDKELYDVTEKAYFTIHPKGYLFNPIITKIQFDFRTVDSTNSNIMNTINVDLKKYNIQGTFPKYLSVDFHDQVFSVKRTKYYPVFLKSIN